MCLSPLFRYPAPVPEILPYAWLRQRVRNKGVILRRHEIESLAPEFQENVQRVPCGRCVECRLARSREWALRIMLEMEYCPGTSWFCTLTYDDDHLPQLVPRVCADTGVVIWQHALVPEHFTNFIKRLRQKLVDHGLQRTYSFDTFSGDHFDVGLRYYGCGEFGEQSLRPHYHICLLNCDLPDIVPFGVSKSGEMQWFSSFLQECWKDPKDGSLMGRTALGKVTPQSAAYVARYIMKKQLGSSRREDRAAEREAFGDSFQDEFVRCSRRPGLGRAYFEEHSSDIYRVDAVYRKLSDFKTEMKPPRYYDALYDLENCARMQEIKTMRVDYAKALQASRLERSDLSDEEYLENRSLKYKDKVLREPGFGTPIKMTHF